MSVFLPFLRLSAPLLFAALCAVPKSSPSSHAPLSSTLAVTDKLFNILLSTRIRFYFTCLSNPFSLTASFTAFSTLYDLAGQAAFVYIRIFHCLFLAVSLIFARVAASYPSLLLFTHSPSFSLLRHSTDILASMAFSFLCCFSSKPISKYHSDDDNNHPPNGTTSTNTATNTLNGLPPVSIPPKESPTTPPPAPKKSTKTSIKKDSGPYSPAKALSLFKTYADSDDPNVIGPEGFEKLCSDAEVSLEGALPLLLAWQLGAAEMGKISKSEWEKGTAELR